MNIVVYINPIFEHQKKWCGAFIEGLKVHGIIATTMTKDIPVDCDVAVMWSHSPTWKNVIADRKKRNKKYIVLDRGYMGDQENTASISINGLHGLSEFVFDGADTNRDEKYLDLYEKWNPGKKYVLLMGQMAGDASLQGIDIRSWIRKKIDEIEIAGYEVVYRPHPRQRNHESYGVPFMNADLETCLKHALCVYTYSSTSGIDALLAGKQVIAESPVSMVYDLVGHSAQDIKKKPKEPKGREQWFNSLACRQYAIDEISNGLAWAVISGLREEAAYQDEEFRKNRGK